MSEPTIHQRIVAILEEMPAIGKNQKNEQQGFMFRGHDDVLNALNPLLAKHGVFVVPDVLQRETAQRTTSRGSVMFEVSLHVRYSFHGADGGEPVVASAWGEGTDMGDKATSKAMTMAFKSVLNQTFAISNAETADPDRQSVEESKAAADAPARTEAKPAASQFQKPDAKIVQADIAASGEATQLEAELMQLYRDAGYADPEGAVKRKRDQAASVEAYKVVLREAIAKGRTAIEARNKAA